MRRARGATWRFDSVRAEPSHEQYSDFNSVAAATREGALVDQPVDSGLIFLRSGVGDLFSVRPRRSVSSSALEGVLRGRAQHPSRSR